MNLSADVARYRSEDKARAYLEQLRWPDGVRCPRCDASKGISRIEKRGQFECDACRYQFSVRVGTIFHASHLPLWKWFLAVYVIGESTTGVSATQLKRILGISYKTAWYLCHRIRAAMRTDAPGGSPHTEHRHAVSERVSREALQMLSSLFKGSVVESYRPLSAKHLPAYLDEAVFRHNNRENAYLFRDTLLRLIGANPVPYAELTASA